MSGLTIYKIVALTSWAKSVNIYTNYFHSYEYISYGNIFSHRQLPLFFICIEKLLMILSIHNILSDHFHWTRDRRIGLLFWESKSHVLPLHQSPMFKCGKVGLEPTAHGLKDHRSPNWATCHFVKTRNHCILLIIKSW